MGDAGGSQPARTHLDAYTTTGTQQRQGQQTAQTTSQTKEDWQETIDILSSLKADLEEEEGNAQKWERVGKLRQAIRCVRDLWEQSHNQHVATEIGNLKSAQLDRIEAGINEI